MARPEGYRKSIRLMNLANKFNLPILTFVDTAGAYPGVGAEQRGQSEAIASSIKTCLSENEERFAVTLLGAESNQAAKVELVGFDLQNGEAAYRPMPQLQIASGSELVLAPNAAAFRLSGIKGHLHAGDSFEVHVIFDRGEVPVTVEVEAAGATQHSHAGHNH